MAAKINIKFPDGSVKEFAKGITGSEILQTLNHKMQKEATGIMVNGEVQSLPEPILGGGSGFVFRRRKHAAAQCGHW